MKAPSKMAEGHILRGLQRLDELLRHVGSACLRLGDRTLAARIQAAHLAVHRDLVCAPSLYVAATAASTATADEVAPTETEQQPTDDE